MCVCKITFKIKRKSLPQDMLSLILLTQFKLNFTEKFFSKKNTYPFWIDILVFNIKGLFHVVNLLKHFTETFIQFNQINKLIRKLPKRN